MSENPTDVPHTMHWGQFYYGEAGSEVTATIVVRHRLCDSMGKRTTAEMVAELRRRMAETLGCPIERVRPYPEKP